MTTPIVIFAFNRPDALERLAASLRQCALYEESPKIVYVDGPRTEQERERVQRVVDVAHTITDDVRCSYTNKGLGASIIAGVTAVVNDSGRAIVMEDDLVPAPGFLLFMNQALDRYETDQRILSVCGYSLRVNRPRNYDADVYLCDRSSSWGWATWRDRWEKVDWTVADYAQFKAARAARRSFNRGGSDMCSMLDGYMEGRNKSWAIRFCYHQWRHHLYSVHPLRSLVSNEGFGEDATNCRQSYSRFKADFDISREEWIMPENLLPRKELLVQNRSYHSVLLRIYSKLRNLI